jgi:glycosyltransferase involved in cell wall biosynthesis
MRRVAFLTPEFLTTSPKGGGLASYLGRMALALGHAGHTPEIFVVAERDEVLDWHGIRIEHVQPLSNWWLKLLGSHWRLRLKLGVTLRQLCGAVGLAQALERRHAQTAFNLVQSADWGLTGFFVPRRRGRTHLVRCSWSRRCCEDSAGLHRSLDNRLLARLERGCLLRADAAYAPSRFTAENVRRDYGVKLAVVRPPVDVPAIRTQAAKARPPTGLPGRYLLHFGLLSAVKGTDLLLRAVKQAWEADPTVTMVFAGGEGGEGYVRQLLQDIGAEGDNRLIWLGALSRSALLATLREAEAAVLPSRSDNLPNTVIEALALGIPVIGSDGASINELVGPSTGRLVPVGDVALLSQAIVSAWNGDLRLVRGPDNAVLALADLHPDRAVHNLMTLAGYDDDAEERGCATCAA